MKLRLLSSTLALGLMSATAHADVLGIYAGAGQWQHDVSGDFRSDGIFIDTENDLGFTDTEDQNLFYIAFEHPVPFLPNIKFQQNDLDMSATNILSREIVYRNQTFSVNEQVSTSFDLTHQDFIFYYEILDNWVNLDLGLNFKRFDGGVSIASSLNSASKSLDDTLPALYGKAQFDLPFTGWSLATDLSYVAFEDSDLTDAKAAIAYEYELVAGFGVGLEAGYRIFNLKLDDVGSFDTDLQLDGAFINVTVNF